MAFDRTLDKSTSLFEFFVPEGQEHSFIIVMQYLIERGIVINLRKLDNRLMDPCQPL